MNTAANPITREDCALRDQQDPLATFRTEFALPEGLIYLDGNSLGSLPIATHKRLAKMVQEEWGQGLISSWNACDWVNSPQRVGAKIARLLGAEADEVIVADSTSINVFKLLAGALALPSAEGRNVILSERGNFPTDLYMAQGLNEWLGGRYQLKLVEAGQLAAALDRTVAVALVTQVDYRSGYVHDMAALNRQAREMGTHIVWDLSHSAGALPVALTASGAELAVGCGYKYLNGGPGAPAYLYVARSLQAAIRTPLSGWFGHAKPFDFSTDYVAAPGIARMQCGTPSVLAIGALECGIDILNRADMQQLRKKSLALSDLFWQLIESHCGEFKFACVSPRTHAQRGSQLSFAHEHAYAIMQALIDHGVVGDFRQPNLLRFGFAPLYNRYVDIWDAVMVLRDVMKNGTWQVEKYRNKQTVT